jgi:hypothetical protein
MFSGMKSPDFFHIFLERNPLIVSNIFLKEILAALPSLTTIHDLLNIVIRVLDKAVYADDSVSETPMQVRTTFSTLYRSAYDSA